MKAGYSHPHLSSFVRHLPEALYFLRKEAPCPPLELTQHFGATTIAGIGKNLSPELLRTQQNLPLLLKEYARTLPGYHPATAEGEKLLERWRALLLEQPRRMAEAKLSQWNTPEIVAFWKARLAHYRDAAGYEIGDFLSPLEDWEHAASACAHLPHPATLGARKARQWQDFVIRNRIHESTLRMQRE